LAVLQYTADELIATVRNIASLPDHNQVGSQSADIIRYLNEEMMAELVPALLKAREEYFVLTRRIPIVEGQDRYRIPQRAIGLKLRDLHYVDGAGDVHDIEHIERERADDYGDDGSGCPPAFHLENNQIVLIPRGGSFSGFLEVVYHFQPGQLVLANQARLIQSVAGGVITLTQNAPSTFTTTARYDIHSPLSGGEIKAFDIPCSNVSAAQLTFTQADIDGSVYGSLKAETGDYVVLAGEAALPALPRELHPVLAQAAACRAREAIGDVDGVAMHKAKLDRMLLNAMALLECRVEGRPPKITNPAGWALYGGGGGRRRGAW
jgi:hypothetical protein